MFLAQSPEHLDTAHAGQHQVQENKVRRGFIHQIERLSPIVDAYGAIPTKGQELDEQLTGPLPRGRPQQVLAVVEAQQSGSRFRGVRYLSGPSLAKLRDMGLAEYVEGEGWRPTELTLEVSGG